MREVAFISDVHSNLPALKSTLQSIKKREITEIYCLGDLVGYHSYANEVIALLKESGVVSIKGNHDKVIAEKDFDTSLDKNFVLTENLNQLTPENINYLNELPFSLDLEIEGTTIKLVHGSPKSISEYIREGSEEAKYYLSNMTTDVLISGHTHLPYITKSLNRYLINTGSVGKPKIGKPLCSYIVIGFEDGKIFPEIVTTPYPVLEVVKHLKERDYPEKFITALETGNP